MFQNQQKQIQVSISIKNKPTMEILQDKEKKVYKIIKETYKLNDNNLVFSNGKVCLFDETFAKFSERIQNQGILSLNVMSLEDVENHLKNEIDLRSRLDQLQVTYKQLQNQYRELDNQNSKLENEYKEQCEQLQQLQNQNEEKFGVQTIYTTYVTTNKESESDLDKEQQNELIRKLLNALCKSNKFNLCSSNQLVTSVLESTYQENNDLEKLTNSEVIQTSLTCFFCQQLILEATILLNCSHAYHQDCLKSLFQSQLQVQNSILSCLCQYKQQQKVLDNFDDQHLQKILKLKLIYNQLNQIITKYKLEKCKTKTCNFYYLFNNNLQQKDSYCPNCLQ